MSVKKQSSSLSKLYTIFEEVPEIFLYETDSDSSFCHKILDIALIDNRIDRVSKGSNKKNFTFKLFQFCNLKNQQRFILEGGGVSFIENTCSFFEHSPSVFETIR